MFLLIQKESARIKLISGKNAQILAQLHPTLYTPDPTAKAKSHKGRSADSVGGTESWWLILQPVSGCLHVYIGTYIYQVIKSPQLAPPPLYITLVLVGGMLIS